MREVQSDLFSPLCTQESRQNNIYKLKRRNQKDSQTAFDNTASKPRIV